MSKAGGDEARPNMAPKSTEGEVRACIASWASSGTPSGSAATGDSSCNACRTDKPSGEPVLAALILASAAATACVGVLGAGGATRFELRCRRKLRRADAALGRSDRAAGDEQATADEVHIFEVAATRTECAIPTMAV